MDKEGNKFLLSCYILFSQKFLSTTLGCRTSKRNASGGKAERKIGEMDRYHE